MLIRRDRKTGAIWIPRPDRATEAELDAKFYRSRSGELRWIPTPKDGLHVVGLYDTLQGSRAVIFGKGPSLDSWAEPKLPGEVWISANEAACVVGGIDFAVMIDPSVLDGLAARKWRCPSGCQLITRIDRRREAERVAAPGLPARYFTHDDRIPWQHATTGTAAMLARAFGIRQALFVGLDGMDSPHSGYAKRLDGIAMPSRAQRVKGWSWQDITAQTVHAIDWTGIEATWWHRDPEGIRRYRRALAEVGARPGRGADGSGSRPTAP